MMVSLIWFHVLFFTDQVSEYFQLWLTVFCVFVVSVSHVVGNWIHSRRSSCRGSSDWPSHFRLSDVSVFVCVWAPVTLHVHFISVGVLYSSFGRSKSVCTEGLQPADDHEWLRFQRYCSCSTWMQHLRPQLVHSLGDKCKCLVSGAPIGTFPRLCINTQA